MIPHPTDCALHLKNVQPSCFSMLIPDMEFSQLETHGNELSHPPTSCRAPWLSWYDKHTRLHPITYLSFKSKKKAIKEAIKDMNCILGLLFSKSSKSFLPPSFLRLCDASHEPSNSKQTYCIHPEVISFKVWIVFYICWKRQSF